MYRLSEVYSFSLFCANYFNDFLSTVHGFLCTQQLHVDAGSGHLCVAGGWNRLWEGVRTVCVPSARTTVWFLFSGKFTVFNYFYNIYFKLLQDTDNQSVEICKKAQVNLIKKYNFSTQTW